MDSSLTLDYSTRKVPRYIAIEGPVGVGKTKLTKMLASTFNYETLLETPEINPFLERFYQNRKQSALPTQLFFLLSEHGKFRVCDKAICSNLSRSRTF